MKLLKPAEVSAITGLSKTATYELLHSKGFPLIVLNKNAMRVDEQELYEYLKKKKVTS